MSTQNNAPLSGGTTDLSSMGTWVKKHTPGWNTEAYDNYVNNLPNGEYAINENDWINQTADKKIAAGHAEHVKQGGTLSLEEFSQGINLNPIISNWNDNDVLDQRTTEAARVAAYKKSMADGGGWISGRDFQKEVDAGRAVVPGYRAEGDTSNFLEVPNNTVPIIKEPIIPDSAEDNGLDDKSSIDENGVVRDANGDTVPADPGEVLGIFDKASKLFGGVFSSQELRRMTLYTVGGIMTGGSTGGSFKWAGTQVLKEQSARAANAAKLGETQAGLFNKAPKQVKIEGSHEPVQAVYMNGQWYDAATKKALKGKIKNWDESFSVKGNIKNYNDLISSVQTGVKNDDGTEIKLGATSHVIVDSWMRQVKRWNLKGYGVDVNDPDASGAFTTAVERAQEANRNYAEGRENMNVPAHFYEATLIQGLSPGGDKNFKDKNKNYLSNEGNKAMVDSIDSIISKGIAEAKRRGKGGTVTLNSVMTNIKAGWGKLSQTQKDQYNAKAGVGHSGFSTFINEQALSLNK